MLFISLVAGIIIAMCVKLTEDMCIAMGNSKVQLPTSMGVLTGKVTMGPLSPVGGISGAPLSAPLTGARIIISRPEGQEIKSVVTDDEGKYSISLPPGLYRIEMPSLPHSMFTKDLPATVSITEGKEIRMDIRVDTGIR
jgi:hypothetical protein